MTWALMRATRPHQWLKNGLVLAAPAAAGVLDQGDAAARTAVATVAFIGASAGTYLLNDIRDVTADRLHPTKRARPIAAGDLSMGTARVAAAVLLVGGVGAGFAVRAQLGLVIASYLAITSAYTLWLKHLPPVDLVAIASGFVLRAVAGAAATDVPISNWFFIVTCFGSLFVVAGKRSGEAAELGGLAADIRSSLSEYSATFLGHVRAMSSGVVLVAYCLWAFEKADELDPAVPWFQITVVPFTIGLLRYAMLLDAGRGSTPERLVLEDRLLLVAGIVWASVFGLGIYTS